MKKRIYVMAILLLEAILLSSCRKDNVEITDTVIRQEYGDWEYINSVTASGNHQLVSSISGYKLNNIFTATLGAEWEKIITLELGYQLGSDEIECSATSIYINSGDTVDFYCRTISDIHEITKTTYTDDSKKEIKGSDSIEYPTFKSIQYGWIISDKNNVIIENTTLASQEPVPAPPSVLASETDIVEKYILESSYSEISSDDLNKLSNEELRYLRNGIYAICGRKFEDKDLSEYYSQYDWYSPFIDATHFHWNLFNSFQQKTIERIVAIEKSRK